MAENKKPYDMFPKNPKEVIDKFKPDEYEDPNTGVKVPAPKGLKDILEDLED